MATHPALVASKALREFTEALGHPDATIGPRIQFSDTVTINAMDLFAAIAGELEMHQLGEPERREHFAEQLVQVIFRNAKTPSRRTISLAGEGPGGATGIAESPGPTDGEATT